jgi:energy-coupling factor transport system permease protein
MRSDSCGAALSLVKLLLLMAYTFSVFFIDSYYFFAFLALGNCCLMVFCRKQRGRAAVRFTPRGVLQDIAAMLPFILLAALINFLAGDTREAVLVTVRLVLVCNITGVFRRVVSSMELAHGIETLFLPLKIFKIKPGDISLMICICVAFIPVLQREMKEILYGLKAKGIKMPALRGVKYLFKPFFFGLFRRTGEIALALKAKGYTD